MKHSISGLGITLLSILVALSSRSLLLLLLHESSVYLGMALGIVFIVMMTVFVGFLLSDLYKSRRQEPYDSLEHY